METEDLKSKDSCDISSSGIKLKLVAIHLGLSDTAPGSNSDHQQELAKRLCESVMLNYDQVNHAHARDDCKPTPVCLDKQCQISLNNHPNKSQHISDPARHAVIQLVKLMEDESSLNCGYGSNLTLAGQAECDASLMNSKTRTWTGVGAVSGCRNPIKLVSSLQDHCFAARPLGLVQPNLIVGSGAKRWMRDHCPQLMVADSRLISASSLARYQKFKSAHDAAIRAELARPLVGGEIPNVGPELVDMPVDTVGAIAVDSENNFHCAISSGGIILKHKGRLGQACVPGAGCWAQDCAAATTTGVGELLSETLLARQFHEQLARQRLLQQVGHLREISAQQAILDCFAQLNQSERFNHINDSGKLVGIMTVNALDGCQDPQASATDNSDDAKTKRREFHLSCGHNGKSMCIGYMTCHDLIAQAMLVRNSHGLHQESRQTPVVQTIKLIV